LTAELSRLTASQDPAPWAAAAEAWLGADFVRERALALLGLAVAHLRTGADLEARDALEQVRDIAQRIGATPLAAEADETEGHAGLGTEARTTRNVAGLTAREREVLVLMARGYSNNRIANELFISPKTVSVHVSSILAKLHASSRTEAVGIAQRTSLLDPA